MKLLVSVYLTFQDNTFKKLGVLDRPEREVASFCSVWVKNTCVVPCMQLLTEHKLSREASDVTPLLAARKEFFNWAFSALLTPFNGFSSSHFRDTSKNCYCIFHKDFV